MRSKYRTRCKECGNWIAVGDDIENRKGNWVHVECPPRGDYSPRTFEARPLNGRNTPVLAATVEGLASAVAVEAPPKKEFKPSKYQEAIFDFAVNGQGNGVVEAVAGSGKTTTLVHLLELLPSNLRIIFLAYNKHIATELKRRAPSYVEVSTVHALGFRQCRKLADLNKRDPVNEEKLGFMMEDFWPIAKYVKTPVRTYEQDSHTRAINRAKRAVMYRLVALAKATLVDYNDPAAVLEMAEHFDVDMNDEVPEYLEKLPVIMDRCKQELSQIDYDDMVWLPVVDPTLQRHMDQYDFILVDEAQDLNASQIKFILSALAPGGRVIAVGDRRQSLYGFRGADVEAIPRLIEMLHATTLPLSISYRNPRSHVERAQAIVPQIEAAPEAKEGVLETIQYKEMVPRLKVGDMVMCRTNAPLIAPAFACIRAGIKAVIRGKDIGHSIIAFIERFDTDDLGMLEVLMAEYTAKEYQKLLDKGKELQADMLVDKMETVLFVAKESTSVADLITKLITLFDDTTEGVVFSSVHRAKGLEADTTYILRPDLMPHPKAKQDWQQTQEMNALYVALTRSRDTMVTVEGQE